MTTLDKERDMVRTIKRHLVGIMVVIGGVFAVAALAQIGGGTGCYVCDEDNCSGPCQIGVLISICDSPMRQANPGEEGWTSIVWPPVTLMCTSYIADDVDDIIDGPCEASPPGNNWNKGPCGSGENCCFLHDNAQLGDPYAIGSTFRCGGYPCSGSTGEE